MPEKTVFVYSYQVGMCYNSLCNQYIVLEGMEESEINNRFLCRGELRCPCCKTRISPETFGIHPMSGDKHRWMNKKGQWKKTPRTRPFKIKVYYPHVTHQPNLFE